jgi:hypothetical protein
MLLKETSWFKISQIFCQAPLKGLLCAVLGEHSVESGNLSIKWNRTIVSLFCRMFCDAVIVAYGEESVNRSLMEIKHKICDIRTW